MGGISGGLWSHYERNAKKMYHPSTTFDWLERRIPEAIPNRVADSIKIEEDLIDAFVVPGMVPKYTSSLICPFCHALEFSMKHRVSGGLFIFDSKMSLDVILNCRGKKAAKKRGCLKIFRRRCSCLFFLLSKLGQCTNTRMLPTIKSLTIHQYFMIS